MPNPFREATRYTALTRDNAAGPELYDHYRFDRGFDAFDFGQWQTTYAEMVCRVFALDESTVLLDLGCAGGANTEGFLQRGVDAWGCDISEYMIAASPFAAGRLRVTSADDLSPFDDVMFDFVHSQQVFEHVPEDVCGMMFYELHRVLRSRGLLFVGLVVAEGEPPAFSPDDDCTHVNVKPRQWWLDLAAQYGFEHEKPYESALQLHAWYEDHPFECIVWRKT